jgi:hypothetical protein
MELFIGCLILFSLGTFYKWSSRSLTNRTDSGGLALSKRGENGYMVHPNKIMQSSFL